MDLKLQHACSAALIGRIMNVQFPEKVDVLSAHVEGTITNARAGDGDRTHVTLEFRGLTRAEQALAIVLDALTQTRLFDDDGPPRVRNVHRLPIAN
jgi:hypothetical protein